MTLSGHIRFEVIVPLLLRCGLPRIYEIGLAFQDVGRLVSVIISLLLHSERRVLIELLI